MKIKYILFLLALTSTLYSQNADSLWHIWKNRTEIDTIRLQAIDQLFTKHYLYSQADSAFLLAQMQLELADSQNLDNWTALAHHNKALASYYQGNYVQSKIYIEKGLYISKNTENKKIQTKCLIMLGGINYEQANYQLAIEYFQKSLILNKELGDNIQQMRAYNNIGLSNYDLGNYPEAITYYQKALRLQEESPNQRLEAICYNNIGEVFLASKDYEKALFNFKKCLEISQTINNQFAIAVSYNNIGNAFFQQKQYDTAISYLEQGLKLNKELGEKKTTAESYNYLGDIYYEEAQYDTAKVYYEKSLNLRESLGYTQGMADSYFDVGRLNIAQKEYQQAIKWCKKGLELAIKESVIPLAKDCTQCLHQAYKNLNDFENALVSHEQYIDFQDQLFNEEKTKKITRLEIEFEHEKEKSVLEKKQQEELFEAQLQQERLLFVGLTIIGLLIALFCLGGFMLMRSNNKKLNEKNRILAKQKTVIEAQVALLKQKKKELEQYIESNVNLQNFAYVVAHDLKAPLRSVKSFSNIVSRKLKNQEDSMIQDALSFIKEGTIKMQQLIDGVLNYSKIDSSHQQEEIDLAQVVEFIANGFTQNNNDCSITIEYDHLPKIQGNPTQINQLFQNLIGNGIKYNDKDHKIITIHYLTQENHYQFSIADNGIGIDKENYGVVFDMFKRLHGDSEYKGTGIGLATCQKIVEKHGGKIWLKSELEMGSTFHFTLPKHLEKPTPKIEKIEKTATLK